MKEKPNTNKILMNLLLKDENSDWQLNKMIDKLIKIESGFVNHKLDTGGPTKYGITHITLAHHLQRPVTIEDVKNLTKETAKEIYVIHYYVNPKIYLMPKALQPLALDCVVNHREGDAIKLFQRTVKKAGVKDLKIDGIFGPISQKYVNLAYLEMDYLFLNMVIDEREKLYHKIVKRNPTQKIFLKGWLKRARSFRKGEK
jgi:lysozyme family protein